MRFGEYAIADAYGVILAHALKLQQRTLRKGHRLSSDDLDALKQAGFTAVTGAQLEDGDIDEDEAATQLGAVIASANLRCSEAATGRVNIYANANGLFVADRNAVDRVNSIDPAITLACLADHVRVRTGDLVATLKIIPLAVPNRKVSAACDALREPVALAVKPFTKYSVSLIATELPSLKPEVMDKTAGVLAWRLEMSDAELVREQRVHHEVNSVVVAIRQVIAALDDTPSLVIVFGASAVIDEDDVVPTAIRLAGGEILRVGMPVDPGNLIVLGRLGETYVIGAPGCARSPQDNGFDRVLDRILVGEKPDGRDLAAMGVGGLLKEIGSRPRPREARQNR